MHFFRVFMNSLLKEQLNSDKQCDSTVGKKNPPPISISIRSFRLLFRLLNYLWLIGNPKLNFNDTVLICFLCASGL